MQSNAQISTNREPPSDGMEGKKKLLVKLQNSWSNAAHKQFKPSVVDFAKQNQNRKKESLKAKMYDMQVGSATI